MKKIVACVLLLVQFYAGINGADAKEVFAAAKKDFTDKNVKTVLSGKAPAPASAGAGTSLSSSSAAKAANAMAGSAAGVAASMGSKGAEVEKVRIKINFFLFNKTESIAGPMCNKALFISRDKLVMDLIADDMADAIRPKSGIFFSTVQRLSAYARKGYCSGQSLLEEFGNKAVVGDFLAKMPASFKGVSGEYDIQVLLD